MHYTLFETLEDRRLLCGTATSSAASTAVQRVATASLVARAATLAPSAVVGHYTGTATPSGTTSHIPISLTITTTRITLTAAGFGTGSMKLTAAQFKKLRAGAFSFTGKLTSVTAKLSGTVTKAGKTIKGSGTVNGKVSGEGSFSLTKS